jgi:hypothetical protein
MAGVVLILGLIFKKPLFAWLNRFGRFKSGDTVLEIPSQVEQQVNARVSGDSLLSAEQSTLGTSTAVIVAPTTVQAVAVDPARAAVIRNVGVSPMILEREAAIRRDVANIPESERLDVLVRHLAVSELLTNAEQIYRLIFGSQLGLLHHLNLYGLTAKTKLIENFFEPAAVKYPAAYVRYSKDEYFHFLESNFLVTSANHPEAYEITVKGKGFLEWIVTSGVSVEKPF